MLLVVIKYDGMANMAVHFLVNWSVDSLPTKYHHKFDCNVCF